MLAGQLFEVSGNPQLNKDSFVFTKSREYPYFTRTVLNNGIAGYVEYLDEQHKIKGNSIAVGMLGMQFFYMEKDFYAGQFTKTIFPRFSYFNRKIALYFISLLNKNKKIFQNVLVKNFEKTFNETKFILPYMNGDLSFSYIEKFIEEVERDYIEDLKVEHTITLNAYLTATELKDYELTKEEKEALERLDSGDENSTSIEWKKVRIGDLFDIHPTKNYALTNDKLFKTKGKVPVIVNSSFNNGVGGYVDLEPMEKGGMVTFSDTTTSDSIFYQNRAFIGYSHVQGMYPYDNVNWTEKSLMYFCIAFRKATKGLFDYGNKFNRTIAKEILITLPYMNGSLCFSFMETVIKALEKLVIKDAVNWQSKKIKAIKEATIDSSF